MNLIEKYLGVSEYYDRNPDRYAGLGKFQNKTSGGKVPIGDYAFEYFGNVKYIVNSAEARKKSKGWDYKVVKKSNKSVVIKADARLHDSLWQSFANTNEPITVKDYH
jgi:hypothetical protein